MAALPSGGFRRAVLPNIRARSEATGSVELLGPALGAARLDGPEGTTPISTNFLFFAF